MQQRLKQRLVGAVVLVALAVIFVPMLLTGPVERAATDVPIEIPPRPLIAAPSEATAPESEAPGVAAPATPSRPIEIASEPAPAESAPAEPPAQGSVAPVVAPNEPAGKSTAPSELASWAVQVGSFGSEANAIGLRDKLRGKGFPAYVDAIDGKARTFYRVRIGPMIQRAEAEQLQSRLAAEEKLKGLVVPHP